MKENLVTSRELSLKLKEAKIPQESEFYWNKDEDNPNLVCRESRYFSSKGQILCSAFLAGELMEWLLGTTFIDIQILCTSDSSRFYRIIFKKNDFWCDDNAFQNACTKMLLYLIEQKLINVKELK